MTTADDGPSVRTRTERVDFLVALEHAPLVLSVLRDHGVSNADCDGCPDLELALITGDFDRSAVPAPVEPDPVDPVEALLARLRAHFERRYARWTPTMGKNRDVAPVTGAGSISHGGGPDPEPAGRGRRAAGRAGLGVTVGVLDTAVYPHPDLAGGYVGVAPGDVLPSAAVRRGDRTPYAAGHATFLTGLVLGQAPAATVRVQGVLAPDGTARSWDVARAIVEIGRRGIQILNLSFVCYTSDGKPPLGLATAIDRLDPDILVIACAGNHGDPRLELACDDDHRKPSWPAALDDVVAVGSAVRTSDGTGRPSYRTSDFTPRDAVWIDVVTRGEGVTSTYFQGRGFGRDPGSGQETSADFADGWATWSGTSFSAALLAGKVAALASREHVSARAAYRSLVEDSSIRVDASGVPRVPPFLDL